MAVQRRLAGEGSAAFGAGVGGGGGGAVGALMAEEVPGGGEGAAAHEAHELRPPEGRPHEVLRVFPFGVPQGVRRVRERDEAALALRGAQAD